MPRFNSPPGWPPPPPGWRPGPGWIPDPSWPPAPFDWQFIVDDDYQPYDSPTTAATRSSSSAAPSPGAAAHSTQRRYSPLPGLPAMGGPETTSADGRKARRRAIMLFWVAVVLSSQALGAFYARDLVVILLLFAAGAAAVSWRGVVQYQRSRALGRPPLGLTGWMIAAGVGTLGLFLTFVAIVDPLDRASINARYGSVSPPTASSPVEQEFVGSCWTAQETYASLTDCSNRGATHTVVHEVRNAQACPGRTDFTLDGDAGTILCLALL